MSKQFTLEELKELHNLIEVFYNRPTSWECFENIPPQLLNAWKEYISSRDRLWSQMEIYGVEP